MRLDNKKIKLFALIAMKASRQYQLQDYVKKKFDALLFQLLFRENDTQQTFKGISGVRIRAHHYILFPS